MSRKLDDLDPKCREKAVEFLARLVENNIQVLIVDTLRTWKEHQKNLATGRSWIKYSKHLPDKKTGKSRAIDVCPYEIYRLSGPDKLQWDSEDPVWQKIGVIGESCGLSWGGRWSSKKKDWGHFEVD